MNVLALYCEFLPQILTPSFIFYIMLKNASLGDYIYSEIHFNKCIQSFKFGVVENLVVDLIKVDNNKRGD